MSEDPQAVTPNGFSKPEAWQKVAGASKTTGMLMRMDAL